MIALWLLGCGTDGTEPTGTEPLTTSLPGTTAPPVLTDPDAPWLDDGTTEDVTVDLDGVMAAVDEAIPTFMALDAAPILLAYRGLMNDSSPGCPDFYQDAAGYAYWLDSCTSSGGVRFEGYGVDTVDEGIDLGDGVFGDILTMGGVGTLEAGDGTTFSFNGYVQLVQGADPSGVVTVDQILVSGDCETNDPVADGTWLGDGLRPNALILHYGILGTGGATIVSGVLEGLPGPFSTVVFDEAVIADPRVGMTDCGLEPSGTASVQLPTGEWVDIVFDPRFDGETIHTDDPAACDGCGTAWYRAEDLGPICFDFSPWLE